MSCLVSNEIQKKRGLSIKNTWGKIGAQNLGQRTVFDIVRGVGEM